MLHEAGQKKHGEHSSILPKWHNDYKYKKSLTRIGWTEQDLTELPRKIINTLRQELSEFVTQNIGF